MCDLRLADDPCLPRLLWREDARGEERDGEEDECTIDGGVSQEWVEDEIKREGGLTAASTSRLNDEKSLEKGKESGGENNEARCRSWDESMPTRP